MNICLLNDSFPPVIDGEVNVLMNYAEHLMREHQSAVIVGTPRYPDADYQRYAYPVVAYPSLGTDSVTNGYRAGNPFAAAALEELAAFSPDIIHSHCPASATVIARLLREKTNAPIVFTYHTKYDIDIERFVRAKLAARETIAAMVGNIEACDEVWVVSRGAGENLRSKSLRTFVERHAGLKGVRFSLSPHRDQGWMENIPLYAASAWARDAAKRDFAAASKKECLPSFRQSTTKEKQGHAR